MKLFNFKGNYKHSLDAKKRIKLPSKLRVLLGDKVIISLGLDNHLTLRNKEEFEKYISLFEAKNQFDENVRRLKRIVVGNSFEIEIDKVGRILIPEVLIDQAKIKDFVQIVGVGEAIEIHSSKKWEEEMKQSTSISEIASKIS